MENQYGLKTTAADRPIDAGLRRHMQNVYNRMVGGVLLTAITAWLVSSSQTLMTLFLGGPQAYVIMLAPLAVVWFGFRPDRMTSKQLMLAFGGLCVLYGISFATIFVAYTGESIARAFFMAAALYAGLSVFGYVSKKNLDGIGTFAVMGVWAVLILAIGTMIAGVRRRDQRDAKHHRRHRADRLLRHHRVADANDEGNVLPACERRGRLAHGMGGGAEPLHLVHRDLPVHPALRR